MKVTHELASGRFTSSLIMVQSNSRTLDNSTNLSHAIQSSSFQLPSSLVLHTGSRPNPWNASDVARL